MRLRRHHAPGSARRGTRRVAAALTVALAAGAVLGGSAGARADSRPQPFRLIFDGGEERGSGQSNPLRGGSFSAIAPVCSSGSGIDRRYTYPYGVLREHTCDDGSGSFTALLDPALAEHGGAGQWKILGGTGRYASLRGRGTFAGEFTGGSVSHEETITFRTTWKGVVGFDTVAPEITGVRATVAKQRRPGRYLLRVSFRTRDDVRGNPVRYDVVPSNGSSALAFADGRARAATVTVALEIVPTRLDLPVLVEIGVTDPLGNDRRVLRSVRLPR